MKFMVFIKASFYTGFYTLILSYEFPVATPQDPHAYYWSSNQVSSTINLITAVTHR